MGLVLLVLVGKGFELLILVGEKVLITCSYR